MLELSSEKSYEFILYYIVLVGPSRSFLSEHNMSLFCCENDIPFG